MVPAGGGAGRDNFNYRIPPSWSPENDSHYSFRAYMTDISLWVMLTDLQPHQQCAAITMRLAGSARSPRDGTYDHTAGDDVWRRKERSRHGPRHLHARSLTDKVRSL